MSNQVATIQPKMLSDYLNKYQGQLKNALPSHITPDRMIRLAMTAFSQNSGLQNCDINSVFGAVVIAAQMGLEIGVAGQGYLVPYKGKATFVPGWQGLVDLVSRSGRATVWTGCVYKGDDFDWALGDRPFVRHRPKGETDELYTDIEYVYACGRVNGSENAVIEVWSLSRVLRHLKKFNKVGGMHYALKDNHVNFEMYARKVALLQVLKYMPKSIEVQKAIQVAHAAEDGKNVIIDGDMVIITDPQDDDAGSQATQAGSGNALPLCTAEEFEKKKAGWRKQIVEGLKTEAELLAMIESKMQLTADQKLTINSWTHE
jgi:recombination protein RecT